MAAIKAYRPRSKSMGSGQVLQRPYAFGEARLVVREMAERLALDLLEQGLVTDQIVLTVGYDRESLSGGKSYDGPVATDGYGRKVPKHAHGSANLDRPTSSARLIAGAATGLFDRIVSPDLLARHLNVVANRTVDESDAARCSMEQLDLFGDMEAREREDEALARERRVQEAVLKIQRKYGKNAVLKAHSLFEGATAMERNRQIGGHKA